MGVPVVPLPPTAHQGHRQPHLMEEALSYVKLDCNILDSTLWVENSETRVVFITMLAMADSDGMCSATAPGIAKRATLPLQAVKGALAVLEAPDIDSRTQNASGRRIERVDGGYKIINYLLYRNKDHTAAARMRKHRAMLREQSARVTDVTPHVTEAEAKADTEANKKTTDLVVGAAERPPCPHDEIIKLYHQHLPMCPAVRIWNEKRRRMLKARWNENQDRQDLKWWAGYFQYVAKSKFLTGKSKPMPGRKVFMADLEWLVNESNLIKVYEGKYHE